MKWSIVGLLSLGLVAAVCAFFLVLSLQDKAEPRSATGEATLTLPPQPTEPRMVDILLAARDVAAYSRLSTEDVRVEKVDLQEAEDLLRKGAFRDPLQVAGRVTEVPIQKDELVVPDMFVRRESGLLITTALAQGKRAVSLSLTDSMGIEGILYPGCYVDVIASLKLTSGQGEARPLSMTLLQSAYVLAVGDRSVVSPEGSGNDANAGESLTGSARPAVTLLVTPDEAELLKLAMTEGSVSLVLRDPRETETREPEPSTRLADLSPTIAALEERARALAQEAEADRQSKRQREALLASFEVEKARADKEVDDLKREHARLEALRLLESVTSPPWRADVIRGGTLESKVFENPIKKGGS